MGRRPSFLEFSDFSLSRDRKANAQKFGLTEFERPELPEYADPSHKYSIFAWKLLKEKNDIIASDELMKQQTESHLEYANSVLNEYNRRN